MDSFHLAVAESSNADIFLTTDKNFLMLLTDLG